MNWRAGLLVGSLGLLALGQTGCGSGGGTTTTPPDHSKPATDGGSTGTDGGGTTDGGTTDGGNDGGGTDGGATDGGTTDGGTHDGGTDGGTTDGGTTDGGTTDGGTTDGGTQAQALPSSGSALGTKNGFELFALTHDADGSPVTVNGITADEGGNIWVAGGTDGLFLLRPGSTTWEQFTLKDGLHPYGFDSNGDDLPGPYYLEVLSVSGGPAGTVYVGYRGRPEPGTLPEEDRCENNWDTTAANRPAKDPSIYQSGDADRVTLNGGVGSGISVVHYDIFSGPNVVGTEPEGRERLCSIYRVLYDAGTHSVWFGGNHGFAWGDSSYPGMKAVGCVGSSWGQLRNASGQSCGVIEHLHPNLTNASNGVFITWRYPGLAQGTNGLWVGGTDRSVHYDFGNRAANFWSYPDYDPNYWIDVWKDKKEDGLEPGDEYVDAVTSVAAMPDGSAWFGSNGNGAARLDANGSVIQYLGTSGGLMDNHIKATAADPSGHGVWFGYGWGGVARYDGSVQSFYQETFGAQQITVPVTDLYGDKTNRRVLVSFQNGVVGIYPE